MLCSHPAPKGMCRAGMSCVFPSSGPAVVIKAQILCDYEGDNSRFLALPEHEKPADSAVSVLERMDPLELHMKIENIVKFHLFQRVVSGKKRFHTAVDILRQCCFLKSDFVRETLVCADRKPRFAAVRSRFLQNRVKLFYVEFGDFFVSVVDHIVYAPEMIDGFNNIIDIRVFRGESERVCLKYKPRLIFRKAAPFNVVRTVCQFDLRPVVNSPFKFGFFLLS